MLQTAQHYLQSSLLLSVVESIIFQLKFSIYNLFNHYILISENGGNLKGNFSPAIRAAIIHLFYSGVVAALAAVLVFGVWYPSPFDQLAGGRDLFLLVVAVDVVCGPILTLVLFKPTKSQSELFLDLSLVAVLQLLALVYGVSTVLEARPLFLVQEVDRFKVISAPQIDTGELHFLSSGLQPTWWRGPITVSIRPPKDENERQIVLLEAVQGGRDYAERPVFYLPYDKIAAQKSLQKAKPLETFLHKLPDQQSQARKLAVNKGANIAQWMYLPIVARQDWIAVLDNEGEIQGFLKGDGF